MSMLHQVWEWIPDYVNPEHEWKIVGFMLLEFAIAFFVKGAVFGVLGDQMMRQPIKSPLGKALTYHYLTLCSQSFFLTLLFFYYGQRTLSGHDWPFHVRLALYVLGSINVYAVAVSGVYLIRVFFQQRAILDVRSANLDERSRKMDIRGRAIDRRGKRQERRTGRQDKREIRQDKRGVLLDEREDL